MKYSPKVNELLASTLKVRSVHPYQPEETIQGSLEIMYKLSKWLAEVTGMDSFSLQPAAGAQGEYTGILIMRAYQKHRGDEVRDEIIVPDSAHGTNPASAAMGGSKVIVIPSGPDGCVDIEALKSAVGRRTIGLMLTNPNTLGIFERRIEEVAAVVHEAGGLLYYDGANLNAILGRARPGDMGFDIVHVNLHKTFSTPHGGGGPGSGPVGVKSELTPFLPVPIVKFDGKKYSLDYDMPLSIGKAKSFYGNFEVLVKAFSYILAMGGEGLKAASETAVLNANYLAKKISKIRGFHLPYGSYACKHEFVVSCAKLKEETGVSARDVAKRLLDYGFHSPTIYFPLIVEEALMVEPTETETIEELDRFVEALSRISEEAYADPMKLREAPYNTSVRALDEARGSHPLTLRVCWWRRRHSIET
jgi:glycine dehydrogenase subunit 2